MFFGVIILHLRSYLSVNSSISPLYANNITPNTKKKIVKIVNKTNVEFIVGTGYQAFITYYLNALANEL